MYKGKQIIAITGRIASGKTTLLNHLRNNSAIQCLCTDELVASISPREVRLKLLHDGGIKMLEDFIWTDLRELIYQEIDLSKRRQVAIEGVKLNKLIPEIIDIYIELKASKKKRLDRALKRGMTEIHFNFLDSLYEK